MESPVGPVVRYVGRWNHLLGIVEGGKRLVFFAFLDELSHQLREDAAVCVAHTHHVLVDVDSRLVDTAELELVHQVVVHLFTVDFAVQFVRLERSEAVGKTFLNEVVIHAEVVFAAYGYCHIDRAFPVGVGQHFEHHQFALVKRAFRVAVGVFQRDSHIFGDRVTQGFRYLHAGTAHGFRIHFHHDTVRRDQRKFDSLSAFLEQLLQLVVLAEHPAVDNLLQFIRVLSEDRVDERQYGGVSLCCQFFGLLEVVVDELLHFRADRDILVLSFHVLDAVPCDRERGRIVCRTLHLVDVPVGLQVTQVTSAGVGTETFRFLVVPQREGIVITVGVDNRVS